MGVFVFFMKKVDSLFLVDGSNFYRKLKSLGLKNLSRFNFNQLALLLNPDLTSYQINYYVGAVKDRDTKKGERLYRKQQSMLANLKKQNVKYFLGYLLKTEGHYHEKGVDVKLAVDMVTTAYEKKAKKIFLISSDTDILPAVRIARSKGVIVIYVGFKHQVSRALIHACSKYVLLTKKELKNLSL